LNYENTDMLTDGLIQEIVGHALEEDHASEDITTDALIPAGQQGIAYLISEDPGILAGINIVNWVFKKINPSFEIDSKIEDGYRMRSGDVIAIIKGEIADILKAERVALNFLQRLSGIATETNRYVEAVKGLPVSILDTRKTTPGLRVLEKYAVKTGGGKNHRMNLADGMLIKDNHLSALNYYGLDLKAVVLKARKNAAPGLQIEVEVSTPQQALQAVEAGADIVMLDNMNLEDMRYAVNLVHGRASIEASGGITLDRVRSVAETGVNSISIGALTHSVKSLDISLDINPLS